MGAFNHIIVQALSLRPLTAEAEFDLRPFRVGFVVHKMALAQCFLPVLQFSAISVIAQVLDTHLHLHRAVTRTRKGRSQVSLQKAVDRTGQYFLKGGVAVTGLLNRFC